MGEVKFFNCRKQKTETVNVEGQAVYAVEILEQGTTNVIAVRVCLSYDDALKVKEKVECSSPVYTYIINSLDNISDVDSEVFEILPSEKVKKGDTVYIYFGTYDGAMIDDVVGIFTKKFSDEEIEKINETLEDNDDIVYEKIYAHKYLYNASTKTFDEQPVLEATIE